MAMSSSGLLESLFNHVALPPRLPGKLESVIEEVDDALMERALNAIRTIASRTPDSHFSTALQCLHQSLKIARRVNGGGKLTKDSLLEAIREFKGQEMVIIYVTEQNAALLLQRESANAANIVFEAFEASPHPEPVLACEGALTWNFPGSAVAIPISVFENESFQDELVTFLEKANVESIKRFAAHTKKAGSMVFEPRDTVEPVLITQMLMSLLEANGNRTFPPLLKKRVRDEVSWDHSGEKPWRRSPFWLVLRVAIQRYLCNSLGGGIGRIYYKFIMCVLLFNFLKDCLYALDLELVVFLKVKVCRRLAKLEAERSIASGDVYDVYDSMFAMLGPDFRISAERATGTVNQVWYAFKEKIKRPIALLPKYANIRHLRLSLPNSGRILNRILDDHLQFRSGQGHFKLWKLPQDSEVSAGVPKPIRDFVSRYTLLAQLEAELENTLTSTAGSSYNDQFSSLVNTISKYLNTVDHAYDKNPGQMGIMLLTVMESWMAIDTCAIKMFCLLKDYHPAFSPEMLDVIQLESRIDMCRLQKIRSYLHQRVADCKLPFITIFANPVKGCFAERYYDESQDSQRLTEVHDRIELAAEELRRLKENEWRHQTAEYEELFQARLGTSCPIPTLDEPEHDRKNCKRCFLGRCMRRCIVEVHEHPLPSNATQAKAVIFEIACPKSYVAYRDCTWRILSTLAMTTHSRERACQATIHEYPALKAYVSSSGGNFSLASLDRSFDKTHFKAPPPPARLKDICVPNSLKLEYYDTKLKLRASEQTQQAFTFAHHSTLTLPANSPFSSLQSSPKFSGTMEGPSSYETLASQACCPPGINAHEFLSFQALFSGKSRRWHQLLIELGSSNVNFGTEATAMLVGLLSSQVGPAESHDFLGVIHSVFKEKTFCNRLFHEINQRLDGVSANWREVYCMETLITLSLRLFELGELKSTDYFKLLSKARAITSNWISALRSEIQALTDAENSRRCSQYAFWAALLCRRTFIPQLTSKVDFDCASLQCFLECSITMQDNLITNPVELSSVLKNALVRDLKMVWRMKGVLKSSLATNQKSILSAISSIWPHVQSIKSPRLKFLSPPNEGWIEVTIDPTPSTRQQTIHFHLLEGHLLFMGEPIGRLPPESRTTGVLQRLFGNQSLRVYRSQLSGMDHVLSVPLYGHEIHVGSRNGHSIVQSYLNGRLMEFIPHETFGLNNHFDLPASLVDDCFHWLDLGTGILEIRQNSQQSQANIWRSKHSAWRLDVRKRIATRDHITLVDPCSPLFQLIAQNLEHFEHRRYLTVFQPEQGTLTVALQRLELLFYVNNNQLLESGQLRAEIDPNQDAGTWYGLNSKLVLRDVPNVASGRTQNISQQQRSILVPMGDVKCIRSGPHVAIHVNNDGYYGRFMINEILGRLECPAEPRLLYLKAMYHAYTSFIFPDPLTGRTGTEEALHLLQSGICKPWKPINLGQYRGLQLIARLTPRREYYPQGLKVMQTTHWDHNLTVSIQHDGYVTVLNTIMEKSAQLSIFDLQKVELPPFEPIGEPNLVIRSLMRRQTSQRSTLNQIGPSHDVPYLARDRYLDTLARNNVLECAKLVRAWPSSIRVSKDLGGILQNWEVIGGHIGRYEKVLLTDILQVNFASDWGALVNLCRESGPEESYHLMFLFASMSFHKDVSMEIIRTLIAFAVMTDLKDPIPPDWPMYSMFQYNQIPCVQEISQLMQPCLVPYPGDERSDPKSKLYLRQREKLQAVEEEYLERQQKHAKRLAEHLLEQWPCAEPNLDEFLSNITAPCLVNTEVVLEVIKPEWLRLLRNMELSDYVSRIQRILDRYKLEDDQAIVPPSTASNLEQNCYPTRNYNLRDWPTLLEDFLSMNVPESSTIEISSIASCNAVDLVTSKSAMPKAFKTDDSITSPGVRDLVASQSSMQIPGVLPLFGPRSQGHSTPLQEVRQLENIVTNFARSRSLVRQQYGNDLSQSLVALHRNQNSPQKKLDQVNSAELPSLISQSQGEIKARLHRFRLLFESRDPEIAYWMQQAELWPCIRAVALLESLRSTAICKFGRGMKESLMAYARAITKLQRLLRIQDAHQKNNKQQVLEESENVGYLNWNPIDRPDWILFEIDANMLIRSGQVDVALATISPVSKSNSVLQMNMGQGKTSCIMPMVAAVLADGKSLLRLVVPKSLLLQTSQLLQSRLGGLLGREVTHVPFSRRTPTNTATTQEYHQIHQNIQESSGVILALPEHMLSFKLSGLQRLSDGFIPEAKEMINVQKWLACHARDVLDECDNILALRTQLIYPSGTQRTVDGHPHRWEVVELLLGRVELHLHTLASQYPQSIEVIWREQGGFPFVYFLRKDVEDELISRLVNDLHDERSSFLPPECTSSQRLAIKQFISEARVSSSVEKSIDKMLPDKPYVRQTIYLLRGLLVHRILVMALKKRWNVQYGLHPDRDPIAVPYMAKGTPSDQAEWGHPDVAILLTCLAFYYGGLGPKHLRQTLEHVLKSDDPSQAYDRFSQASKLPDSLREWNSINVDDDSQLKELWMHLRYQVVVISYFLNTFVFPRHAKQFQIKLQASGWDIPLLAVADKALSRSQIQEDPVPLTTGFSGTNDGKRMLPLTIHQCDLPGLAHTNAEVLTYLLQVRNRRCISAAYQGRHLSERALLEKISKEGFRVFIDAGAQILEMDNFTLVKTWLEIDHNAPAALYFDEVNKPMVLYRQGNKIVPLLASPYAEDLGGCLVYLDEAHTRGTDLKLSRYAKGALTLGLGQTKDHTVQAAMRLRQLGTTQSMAFFCPPEVYQSILDTCEKPVGYSITSTEVIRWLLEQTCIAIEQYQPLYHSQGVEFCRRTQAALDNCNFITNPNQREGYLSAVRQVEQQTLKQLYGLNSRAHSPMSITKPSSQITTFLKVLDSIKQGLQDSGIAVHASALQEVEQEREVAYEVEAIREVQKQIYFDPFKFPGTLHRDIKNFAKTGRLTAESSGYENAFIALQRTTLGRKHSINPDATYGKLLVSTEFTKTVIAPSGQSLDQFLRPVNWVLWSSVCEKGIIVIPEEAELLIPLVKNFVAVPSCYLLTYAAPVTRKMLLFGELQYYAVPRLPADWTAPLWLRTELGIYSGRLYFDYSEYKYLLDYLGLETMSEGMQNDDDNSAQVDDSGLGPQTYVMPGIFPGPGDQSNEEMDGNGLPPKAAFTRKPLTFLQEWLAVRRKGQDFSHSPMGFICQGQRLLEKHTFFQKLDHGRSEIPQPIRTIGATEPSTEEGDDGADMEIFGDHVYGKEFANKHDDFDDTQLNDVLVEQAGNDDGVGDVDV